MAIKGGFKHWLRMYAIFAIIEILFALVLMLAFKDMRSEDGVKVFGGSILMIFGIVLTAGALLPTLTFGVASMITGSRSEQKIVHIIISFVLILATFLGIFVSAPTIGVKGCMVFCGLLMASCLYATISGFITASKAA